MVYLSWNLARNVRISEAKLFEAVKNTLMRSLRQVLVTLEYVRSKGCEVKFHGRSRGEAAHFCGQCEVEVFGVLFIREQERRHVVHCLDCARKRDPELRGFVCLEEYHGKELRDVYNNFKLTTAQSQLPFPRPGQQGAQISHGGQQMAGHGGAGAGGHTAPHPQSPLTKSPSSAGSMASGVSSMLGSGMSASSLSSMMSSMASMTPQQQLALQQALAQQQALLNQS